MAKGSLAEKLRKLEEKFRRELLGEEERLELLEEIRKARRALAKLA